MRAIITPSPLAGTIPAIASKSQAHRMLICAALADRPTTVACPTLSADITATADCLRALGADINYENGLYTVRPIAAVPDRPVLDCGESGSTLRFLLPVVCALGAKATVKMHGRLGQRPLSPLWEELQAHGAVLTKPDPDTISVEGSLAAGEYTIAANISSQFISGLLFALPLLLEGSSIRLTGTLESAAYLTMTVRALSLFGVACPLADGTFSVPGGRPYASPGAAQVEGDWSNAAFWTVADKLSGGALAVTGLDPDSPQGDRAVTELAERIAAGNAVIDCQNVPDLVPVLSVLAALTPGTTRFVNAGRLRIKESDRLTAVTAMLTALGGDVQELDEGLVVTGKKHLAGGTVDSVNDHRIAMSAAVAAIGCDGPVTVLGAQAVNKSYPAFWDDYARLGGKVTLEDEI